jgi:ribokinase
MIVVVGSINMDLVIRCAHLPRPGETLIARHSSEVPGGKGANQAVAASRLGAQVHMIGAVGSDAFAPRLLDGLRREAINPALVRTVPNVSSGLAIVAVDDRGENSIIVVPGANHAITEKDIDAAQPLFQSADIVVLQLEIPLATAQQTVQAARRAGARVILNPAPAPEHFPSQLFDVDVLCPNQSEAERILGTRIDSIDAAKQACQTLIERGAGQAVITLGERGSAIHDGRIANWIPPYKIDAVDTTAAGDAYCAAMAWALAQDQTLENAARFASAAGALAASCNGAQPSLPTAAAVEAFRRRATPVSA